MKQLTIDKREYTACVFTGHRELGKDFSPRALQTAIIECIEKGVTVFYNGVARGFDLLAAEAVLNLKKIYDIKLIACVPYYGQERGYNDEERARYCSILSKADEVVVLSEEYYKGCLLRRNDYMVERADCMIAYLSKEQGGTAYTVNKFRKKKGDNIFFLGKQN